MDVAGVAFITGASGGIGAVTALTFASDGCSGLALADVNGDALAQLKESISTQASSFPSRKNLTTPLRIETDVLDVTDEATVNASLQQVASKHVVMGLTKTASEDYAAKGTRVNAMCPGYIETPMMMTDPVVKAGVMRKVENEVPMGRLGRPEEIADGIVWLCGGRSSFVQGAGVVVDGGYTSR